MRENTKKQQFIVLGLGKFGISLARTLHDLGHMVLCVDRDEATVQRMSETVPHVMQLDVRDAGALKEIDIAQFDAAVIAVGDLESSLMCTMLCQEMGIKRIIVKAINERHGRMAEKLGATLLVFSERDTGRQIAHRLALSHALNYIELDDNIHIVTLQVPNSFLGKNLIEINLRENYNLNVIAVRSQDRTTLPPDPHYAFKKDDQFIVIGRQEDIAKFNL